MKTLVTGGYGMVGSAMETQIKLSREICDLTNPKQKNKIKTTTKKSDKKKLSTFAVLFLC